MKVLNRAWLVVVSLYLAYNTFFVAHTYRHFMNEVINGYGKAAFEIDYKNAVVELLVPLLILCARRFDRYSYYAASLVFASWLTLNDFMFVILQYVKGDKYFVPVHNRPALVFFDASFCISLGALVFFILSVRRDIQIKSTAARGTCMALCVTMYVFEVAERLPFVVKQFLYSAQSPWAIKHGVFYFDNDVWVAAATALTGLVVYILSGSAGLTVGSTGRPSSAHFFPP